jgi:Kyakuja-Dileera-Zisupton transposase
MSTNVCASLSHLVLYQKGLGLEDLGVCEHTFSKSNPMGVSCAI